MRVRIYVVMVAAGLFAPVSGPVAAQDVHSANHRMIGCRYFLNGDRRNDFEQGVCVGIIDALAAIAPEICVPKGARSTQGVRVVVQYIDAKPARHHEDFKELALEGLKKAWPCNN